jgi:hypothetical protein
LRNLDAAAVRRAGIRSSLGVCFIAALIVAAAAAAGCGGAGEAIQTVVVTETVEATRQAAPAASADEAGEESEQEAVPSAPRPALTLPDVIGERLDVAESALDDLGISYEEVGGGTFGVVDASAWTVCDQRPAPGARGATVKLIVARPGDCDSSTRTKSGAAAPGLPDVVGQRLDVAEDELQDAGVAYEIIGGGTFGVLDHTGWTVCEQRPAPGAESQHVKLIVDRPGDC